MPSVGQVYIIEIIVNAKKNRDKNEVTSQKAKYEKKKKSFTTQSRLLTTLRKKSFGNILEKRENAGKQHFLLFPQYFLPMPSQILIFHPHLF